MAFFGVVQTNSLPHRAAKESETFPSPAGQPSLEPPSGGLLTSPFPPCTHKRRKEGQRPCPGAKRRAGTTGQARAQPSWQRAFSKHKSRPEGWPSVTGTASSTPSLPANVPVDQAGFHRRAPSRGLHRAGEMQEKAAVTHQRKRGVGGLVTAEADSTVLEVRSKRPRCWQAHAPPEGSGDVLGSFSSWWLPARPRCFLACVFTTPTPACLHMASSPASLGLHFLHIKVTSHWTQGPPDSRRTLS